MERVLLVNDSRFESIIMKDMLSNMGFDVKVSDEYDAISLVRTYKPDFLISNYIMKEIRGDQLISMVKLHSPGIRCFLCSSSPLEEETSLNRRIDAFIKTPVQKSELEKTFTRFISNEGIKNETVSSRNIAKGADVKNVCEGCGREIARLGELKFAFCPYCGHKFKS